MTFVPVLRRRAALLVAVILAIVMGLAPPAVASGADAIQLVALDTSARPAVTLVVSAPPRYRGTLLGPEAFTVSVGGSPVPVTAAAVAPSTRTVAVVVDTSEGVTPEGLDRQRAAAAELLRNLDAGTNVALVTSVAPFVVVGSTADVASTMAALGSLGVGGRAELDRAVQAASAAITTPPAVARTVLFTADPAAALKVGHAGDGAPVDAVALDPAAATALEGQGVTVHPGGASGLASVDGLIAQLTDQYQLQVAVPAEAAGPLQVGVDAGGGSYRLAVDLPAPPATTAPPTTPPPTTPAPTTLAPTTLAPTTIAPTTIAEPTTVAQATTSAATTAAPAATTPTAPAAATTAPHVAAPRPLLNGPDQSVLSSPLRWVFLGACVAGLAILTLSLTFRLRERRRRQAKEAAARQAAEASKRAQPHRAAPLRLGAAERRDPELLAILERLRRDVAARPRPTSGDGGSSDEHDGRRAPRARDARRAHAP